MRFQSQVIRLITATSCVFTLLTLARAEGLNTAQGIMDFSTAKSSEYKTWTADYTQTMSMMGAEVRSTGQMIHQEPGKMWIHIDTPVMGQQTKITMVMGPDHILWQAMEMGGQHQISKIDMNRIASNMTGRAGSQLDPLARFDPNKQWTTSREMFDFAVANPQTVDGQPMYVLDGRWKASALTNAQTAMAASMIGKSRMFIGQKDGFLHRLEQFDKSGTNLVMSMDFKNVKFNMDVPDSTFIYQPPAGASVMDMTPMVEMQMGGAKSSTNAPPSSMVTPPAAPLKQKPSTP